MTEALKSSGYWAHCSPQLLDSGVSCGKTPRRICSCGLQGSHDHWVERDTSAGAPPKDLGEMVFQDQQYLLLGSRECDILVGYWREGDWFANCDGDDYLLQSAPKRIISLCDRLLSKLECHDARIEEGRYHLAKLSCGRYQIGFQEAGWQPRSGQWQLDVFGAAEFRPAEVISAISEDYSKNLSSY